MWGAVHDACGSNHVELPSCPSYLGLDIITVLCQLHPSQPSSITHYVAIVLVPR